MAEVLPYGRYLLVGVLYLTYNPSFWLNDITVMSPGLLNDVGHASLILPAIYLGIAFIGLGGVNFGFLNPFSQIYSYFPYAT
jgi:hypothetical protein